MKYFGEGPTKIHFITLTKDEEIMQTMIDFCDDKKIQSGFFHGIGGISSGIIAHFNVKIKRFRTKIINEHMEIAGLFGIISRYNNKPHIHCHASFADVYMQVIGGHLKEAIVGSSVEIVVQETNHKIERQIDQVTELNFLSSKKEEILTFPKHARGEIGP